MSSNACCSGRDADTFACHWNCDQGFQCSLNVKTNVPSRRKREFTPDEQKDENYWMKRSRNNEAAKRSRERRRVEERLLEERALHLYQENEQLKAALRYHGVGKGTSYDAFMDYSAARELSRDPYLRALVEFPGAHRARHYALGSVYNSVPLPRIQNFPAASFPLVDNTLPRDRYLGIYAPSDGNVPSSASNNTPCALPPRKWAEGHAHATVSFDPNPAPCSLNETVPGYQCCAGSARGCAAHARGSETHVEQRSHGTEASRIRAETKTSREPARGSTAPLLPHKLRYKAQRALSSPPISHSTQNKYGNDALSDLHQI